MSIRNERECVDMTRKETKLKRAEALKQAMSLKERDEIDGVERFDHLEDVFDKMAKEDAKK
jgi:hypothetical protein